MKRQPILDLMELVGDNLVKSQRNIQKEKVEYKKGLEVVSILDRQIEQKIRKRIKRLFPKHKIWGEELGKDQGNLDEEKYIIIDPIDGTKNYLSGNPLFASQIACIEKGEIKWGVISLPALKEIYWAERGKGAFLNEKKIEPSMQGSLKLSLQCFGIGHDPKNYIKLARKIKSVLIEPRHYGCAGVHYAFVANGRTDIYIANEAAVYDLAAGILLCQEAGLEFCTLEGKVFKFGEKNMGVVIANKKLIAQYKKLVKKVNL